ncbi:MAG: hypothetical protein GX171_09945 [Clostridiales bacterium]|jgi:hypothetical protein|nr:hypothetical protein [Clostridiales bacterium]
MLVYFCPKCVRQNAQPHCDSCGRSLGNPSVRYVWEDSRLALSNTHRLGLMARAIAITVVLVVLVMLIIEYIINGAAAFTTFFRSTGIPTAAIGYGIGLMLLIMLGLFLQGRETVQYMLDPKGVLKRTWIEPTRLKCWSRFIRYDQAAFQQNNEGKPFLLAHEEYLLWTDTARYKPSPRAGRITLYRPYAFVFMVLYLPRQEYDGAMDMIAAKLKNKR